MPITITPPVPAGAFFAGGTVELSTLDVLPQPSSWNINWFGDADATQLIWTSDSLPVTEQHIFIKLFDKGHQGNIIPAWPAEGATTAVNAFVRDSNNQVVSSGVQTAPFSSTLGLAQQARDLAAESQGGSGFTDSDRAMLTSINAWSVLDTFITQLEVEDLGVSAPGGNISAQLPDWRYGVIVRMTEIDAALTPQTPDLDYWVKTLATVRLFRDSDIVARIPIHRSSQIIPFSGNGIVLQLPVVELQLWAPGLSIQVDFLPNCAGQVLLMKLP